MNLKRCLFTCPSCKGSRVLQEHDLEVVTAFQAYCYACESEMTLLSDEAPPTLPSRLDTPHVMIGVVTRGVDMKQPFVLSLLRVAAVLRAADIRARVVLQSGGSIQIARNRLVTTMLESDATHLMMIDDDLEFLAEDIVRFVAHDRDVVAGAYATREINWMEVAKALHFKRDPRLYTSSVTVHLSQPLERDAGLARADVVAGGFTMIKRSVFERMMTHHPELRFWNEADQKFHSMLFDNSIDERGYCSEDVTFSRRWAKMGGKLWVDEKARFSHVGALSFMTATLGERLDEIEAANREPGGVRVEAGKVATGM